MALSPKEPLAHVGAGHCIQQLAAGDALIAAEAAARFNTAIDLWTQACTAKEEPIDKKTDKKTDAASKSSGSCRSWFAKHNADRAALDFIARQCTVTPAGTSALPAETCSRLAKLQALP